jgi:anthranilate synthase component II
MKILVVDNYDSFTYNLVHALEKLTRTSVAVVRNDEISLADIAVFDRIVLSPGPGLPVEAGSLLDVISTFYTAKPILGVCLGHQAIAEALGGSLRNLSQVLHGVHTICQVVAPDPLFKNMPDHFQIGHYHSWVVNEPLPLDLIVTARDEANEVMAFRHQAFPLRGVQFHPESVLTPLGEQILDNWLRYC